MLLSVSSGVGIGIDVIIIALMLILAFIGLKKGFIKSIISMISTLVVVILSVSLAGPVAKLLNKIYDFTGFFAKKICPGIAKMGGFYSTPIPNGVSGADIAGNIPSSTNGFLKKLMSNILKPLSASQIEGATVAEIVSGAFASIIMTIIAGILLFIVIKIVIALVSKLFENINRIRVFGFANKLLGFIFGAIKGLLIVIVFTFVLTLLTVVPMINKKVSPVIQDHTRVEKIIYNYTDEMVGKHLVNGKLVQKWVDNLWENKYKDKLVVPSSPKGSKENPYEITFEDNQANLNVSLPASLATVYYKFNIDIEQATFNITIVGENANCSLYLSGDLAHELSNENLNSAEQYVLAVQGTADGVVSLNVTLTILPND